MWQSKVSTSLVGGPYQFLDKCCTTIHKLLSPLHKEEEQLIIQVKSTLQLREEFLFDLLLFLVIVFEDDLNLHPQPQPLELLCVKTLEA